MKKFLLRSNRKSQKSGVFTRECMRQTKTRVHNEPSFFFYFLAKSLEISRFRDKHNGLVLPCFRGWTSPFFVLDHMFDHLRRFWAYFWLNFDSFKAVIASCEYRLFLYKEEDEELWNSSSSFLKAKSIYISTFSQWDMLYTGSLSEKLFLKVRE